MAENGRPTTNSLAEPNVGGGFPISPIWLFPIVALIIGGWLVFQTLSQKGPIITIAFKTADGIEAKETKIKFREVEVGLVESIAIKKDLSGVIVTAEMKKEAAPHLTDATRFWVVRPRIGLQGISGLGTLVSGAFIEIDPGKGGDSKRAFLGLEDPPLITTDEPGKEFTLVADKLGSYTSGSPVYYRGIEVGEVLGHQMAENRKEIQIRVFIHEPHDQLVRDDSRFWNASGINVSINADGMDVKIESLAALALGGIAFDTPSDLKAGTPSKAYTRFRLHQSETAVDESKYTQKFRWVLYFEGSVRGLSPGAPVEFKGIKIGSVVAINLLADRETMSFLVPVLVDLEPERMTVVGEGGIGRVVDRDVHETALEFWIASGLRARLKTSSLITGQLLVDLDFHPGEKAVMRGDGKYPEIPTIPSSIEEITRSLTALVDKVQALPLEELTVSLTNTVKSVERLMSSEEIPNALKSLDQTLATLNRVMDNVDQKIAPETRLVLVEANKTLKTVREAISQDSPLRYDLETTLQELAGAVRSIRLLAEYLESNPNALIYGKTGRQQQ